MSDILCVTSRQLCREDFLARLERIAAARPAGIVLREKDLSPAAYRALAGQVLEICRRRGVPCILHAFPDIAEELGADGLHLPLPALRLLSPESRKRFRRLGASCHSAAEPAVSPFSARSRSRASEASSAASTLLSTATVKVPLR